MSIPSLWWWMLISSLWLVRSLKIWVCDRKIDWTLLSLVTDQAKVKFVSSLNWEIRIFGECRLHSITRLLGVIWSSEEAHTVDALAVRGDERRGSLRKASGSRQTDFDPEMSEWGNPAVIRQLPYTEYIGVWSEPGELKHLSTLRKRNQPRFP